VVTQSWLPIYLRYGRLLQIARTQTAVVDRVVGKYKLLGTLTN
jgi:hypothetical protein